MRTIPLAVVRDCIRGSSEIIENDDGLTPLRLPRWTRAQQSDRWVEFWSAHTVGVRIVTVTAATRIELDVSVTRMLPEGLDAPLFPASVIAEVEGETIARADIEAGPLIVNHIDRSWSMVDGPTITLGLDLGRVDVARAVTIWLPHNGHAEIRAVRADAPLVAAPVSDAPQWLHHGSSISHSLEARDPRGPWVHQAAQRLGLEITNLSIAGNAQLDPFVARTIAAHKADVISLKLGVNIINSDSMRARTFVPALHGFLDLVREGHPTVPLLVISPIACPPIEHTPGPTHKEADGRWYGTPRTVLPGDGTLTLGEVRRLVREVVRARQLDDELLWYEDGLQLFGASDAELLWDGLHPNQDGYDLIANRFVNRARNATGTAEAFSSVLS